MAEYGRGAGNTDDDEDEYRRWKEYANRNGNGNGSRNRGANGNGSGSGNREGRRASDADRGPAGPFLKEYPPGGEQPQVSAQKALVRFYRGGGHSVITVTGTEHVGKGLLARPHTVCEIALGTYETTLEMELPAVGATTFFKAEVDIHWTVVDPHLVAVQVVTDIAKRLSAPVLERLREVTSAFRVHEVEQADRAIARECASPHWGVVGGELGLNVRLYVRLRADDRTIEHMDGIRDAHASAEVTRVHQQRFRAMLQGGELAQLSFMLAAAPEEAKDFLEKIRQERPAGREGARRPAVRHGRERSDPVQRRGDAGPQSPGRGPAGRGPRPHRLTARPPQRQERPARSRAGAVPRHHVHTGLGVGRSSAQTPP